MASDHTLKRHLRVGDADWTRIQQLQARLGSERGLSLQQSDLARLALARGLTLLEADPGAVLQIPAKPAA